MWPSGKRVCFVINQLSDDMLFSARKCLLSHSSVTFLYCIKERFKSSFIEKIGIKEIFLDYKGPPLNSLQPAVDSFQLYSQLQHLHSQFDVICFPFQGGLGYYSFLAQKMALSFQETLLAMESPPPQEVSREITTLNDLAEDFLEIKNRSLASALFSKEGFSKLHVENISNEILDTQAKPLVSVCLTHFNRPLYLKQAIDSLLAQDYPHFEVVLVDDASSCPEAHSYLNSLEAAFSQRGWKIIRNSTNVYPGASRNSAAKQSLGEYLLFMDDDNIAKPHEISTLVKAAVASSADIVTCPMDYFIEKAPPLSEASIVRRYVPLGGSVDLGLHLNLFGDMNALIRKETFFSLGGLTEDKGIGGEDWEFFAKAALKGCRLEVVPKALFWYRDTPKSITKSTDQSQNTLRALRPYLDAVSPLLQKSIFLAHHQQKWLCEVDLERQSLKKTLAFVRSLCVLRTKKVLYRINDFVRNFI